MAWNPVITAVIPNYSSDGTNMTLPIASFSELTAAEAHTTTGDSRKLIFAVMERLFGWFNGLVTADRPSNLTIIKSTSTNVSTGVNTLVYTVTIKTSTTAQEVIDEV